MAKIKILPPKVARKIAAGEVIERPASVVKELCENAFDAKAQNVTVELWDGGLSLIRVRDDGLGMEIEDLKRCYLPHATSKIEDEDDLLKIRTWGFRGEALASISAVSELIISSKAKGALLGGKIRVKYGKLLSFSEKGLPTGTTVEVLNLFSNVPARKAFLKSPRAETAKVTELVRLLAFENPAANLSLFLAGRESFRYESSLGRLGLLAQTCGLKSDSFIYEDFEIPPYRLEIILSTPKYTFPTTKHIYFLVNNRVVKDRLIASAVYEGLKPAFARGKYPALVLALEVPPELVDVNVHPAKWEVRFREEGKIFSLVKRAVENLLKPKAEIGPSPDFGPESEADIPLETRKEKETMAFSTFRVSEESPRYGSLPFWALGPEVEVLSPFGEEFFVLKEGDQVIFFDFHAAQERLVFEDLKDQLRQEGSLKKQRFLTPEPLPLSGQGFANLEKNLKRLEKLGFEIEILAPGEAFLRAAPALLKPPVGELIAGLLERLPLLEDERLLDEALALIACRAAKKAGDKVASQEIRTLYLKVKEKGLTRCPHGRPFYWSIDLEEVRKKLGR